MQKIRHYIALCLDLQFRQNVLSKLICSDKHLFLAVTDMGLFSAILVNVVGGAVIYGTGGLGAGLVAPMMGFGTAGIAAGSTAAAAQAYYGNLVAGSIISQLTSVAMVAPIP